MTDCCKTEKNTNYRRKFIGYSLKFIDILKATPLALWRFIQYGHHIIKIYFFISRGLYVEIREDDKRTDVAFFNKACLYTRTDGIWEHSTATGDQNYIKQTRNEVIKVILTEQKRSNIKPFKTVPMSLDKFVGMYFTELM